MVLQIASCSLSIQPASRRACNIVLYSSKPCLLSGDIIVYYVVTAVITVLLLTEIKKKFKYKINIVNIFYTFTEFEEGREWIKEELVFNKNKDVNFFEVTIRVLGALLTNYHFTQDDMFLNKAVSIEIHIFFNNYIGYLLANRRM